MAGLYYRLTINQFAPEPSSGFTIEVLQKFTNDNFIRAGRTIVFEGPSGSGKTALCCAAAMEAMKMGYSAKFYRMYDLLGHWYLEPLVGPILEICLGCCVPAKWRD